MNYGGREFVERLPVAMARVHTEGSGGHTEGHGGLFIVADTLSPK